MATRGIPSLNPATDPNTTPPVLQQSAPASVTFDTTTEPGGTVAATTADAQAKSTVNLAAGMVLAGLILLWALGGIVFRSVNL